MLTRTSESCKHKNLTTLARSCLAFATLALSACVSAPVQTQSFRMSENSQVESAQIAVDADFGRYSSLQASELGIYFAPTNITTPADLDRIRQIFRDAFLPKLDGYAIVSEPGPSTMTVEASLVDLRNASATQMPPMRSAVRDLAKPGSILFLMEMRDSQSGRVLARAADSAKAPAFATTAGTNTDWSSIEDAAQHWAALFRVFLDENLNR